MAVRGAPAIGVTGALALAVHLISGGNGQQYSSLQACVDDIAESLDYLVTRYGCRKGAVAKVLLQEGCQVPFRFCAHHGVPTQLIKHQPYILLLIACKHMIYRLQSWAGSF
jgi:hypothetical protein